MDLPISHFSKPGLLHPNSITPRGHNCAMIPITRTLRFTNKVGSCWPLLLRFVHSVFHRSFVLSSEHSLASLNAWPIAWLGLGGGRLRSEFEEVAGAGIMSRMASTIHRDNCSSKSWIGKCGLVYRVTSFAATASSCCVVVRISNRRVWISKCSLFSSWDALTAAKVRRSAVDELAPERERWMVPRVAANDSLRPRVMVETCLLTAFLFEDAAKGQMMLW